MQDFFCYKNINAMHRNFSYTLCSRVCWAVEKRKNFVEKLYSLCFFMFSLIQRIVLYSFSSTLSKVFMMKKGKEKNLREKGSSCYWTMRKDDDVRKKGKIYFDEKLEEKLLSRKIMISHKIQLWNFYAHTWRMCMIFSVVYIKDSPYFSASSYTFKILLLLLSILLYVLLAFLSVFPLTHSVHRHECERVQIDQNQDEWIPFFYVWWFCQTTKKYCNAEKDLFDTLCLRCHVNFPSSPTSSFVYCIERK